MTSGDFLNYVASISILIFIGFISYLLYNFTITVRKANVLFEIVTDVTKDIKKIEKKIKKIFTKGGEKNMQKMNGEKKHQSEKGANPLVAGSMGAVAGAAIGAAAATVLSNKKTRERVGETFSNLREQAMGTLSDLQERTKTIGARSQAMKVVKKLTKKGRPKKK